MVAETLEKLCAGEIDKTLLISLGNSLRSDDGVGPFLAERLATIPGIKIENAGNRPERAIDFVSQHRPQTTIFIDAADFGAAPGSVRQLEPSVLIERSLSCHRLPLAALINWIETEYPTRCLCLGIQAGSMQLGEQLTPEVAQTAQQIFLWFEQRMRQKNSAVTSTARPWNRDNA